MGQGLSFDASLRFMSLVSKVIEQEEFEWEVVGADLSARHALKVSQAHGWLEVVLRAMPAGAAVESRLTRRLGRPAAECTGQRELTTQLLEQWANASAV